MVRPKKPDIEVSQRTLNRRRQREIQNAIAQGIDPATLGLEQQKFGPARQPNPSKSTAKKQRQRDRKKDQEEDMSSYFNLFTGGSKEPPKSASKREQMLDKVYDILGKQIEGDEKQMEINKQASQRRLVDAEARRAVSEAEAAEARASEIRQAKMQQTIEIIAKLTPGKKKRKEPPQEAEEDEDDVVEPVEPSTINSDSDPEPESEPEPEPGPEPEVVPQRTPRRKKATVIEPTPVRKTPAKKTPATRAKSTRSKTKAAARVHFENPYLQMSPAQLCGYVMGEMDVDALEALSNDDFHSLLVACDDQGLFQDVLTNNSRKKKLDVGLLASFCDRLNETGLVIIDSEKLSKDQLARALMEYIANL